MKRVNYFLTILTAALMLTACAQSTPEPVTYTIEMSEYAFTPDTIEVQAGQQVTLNLVNRGALEHEIMFGRNVMMMDNHPNGYQTDMFEETGVEPAVMMMASMEEGDHEDEGHEEEGHSGFMVLLPESGAEATLSFTATPEMVGEWEMGCFELEGVHYTSGMVGKFIVNP